MAWEPPTPRCLHPVEFRAVNEPRNDVNPVCYRPAGHAERDTAAGRIVRHLSRWAYLRELERSRKNRGRYPGYYRTGTQRQQVA